MIVDDPADYERMTENAYVTFGVDYEINAEVIDLSQIKNEDYNEQDIEANLVRKGNRLLNN